MKIFWRVILGLTFLFLVGFVVAPMAMAAMAETDVLAALGMTYDAVFDVHVETLKAITGIYELFLNETYIP